MNRRSAPTLPLPSTLPTLALPCLAIALAAGLAACGGRLARDAGGDTSPAGAVGAGSAADHGAAGGAGAAPPAAIAPGESMAADFDGEAAGQAPRDFAPLVGAWAIGAGEAGEGLVFDGSAGGPTPAADLAALASDLFGKDGSLLTAAVTAAPLYAFCAYRPLGLMADGRVSVRFRPDGSGDQAAGIVFGLRANGDYLVTRANGPEANLVLISVQGGRRNLVARQTGVAVAADAWHDLRVTVSGAAVTAQVDEQPALKVTLPAVPEGRVGLWSVSDRAVRFDDFAVEGGR